MLTVYGIPTCDSCRKARKWLDAHGHVHAWVDVRQIPPDAKKVADWVDTLGAKKLKRPILARDGVAVTTGFRGWDELL